MRKILSYRRFAAWLLLPMLSSLALAAPQVLTAHPVVHGLAQELTRGTEIVLLKVTPDQLPAARHPAFLAGRGLEALQNAAAQAEAVLTLRSIWPDDPLYPLARRRNIRIVEIDAAQPLEGDQPGISLGAGDNALNARPWLDGSNLSHMAAIMTDAFARLHPTAASVFQANLAAMQGRLRQLDIDSTLALAKKSDLSALAPSRRVQALAQALKLEILPCADDEAAFPGCLQREKVRLVLLPVRPDAPAIQAIQMAGSRLVVVPEFSGNPVEALENAVHSVLDALE